jgi:ParB-like chromosome segregation protein Spo0J
MRTSDLATAATIYRIPVDAIAIPDDRLRSLKQLQAAAIGAAIVADRQYSPISVAQLPGQAGFVLVDGLHRLEGLRLQGATEIDAQIVSDDRASRRREEIASAWARAAEDAFDRGAQIAALADLARSEDEVQCIALGLKWDEETAEALGVSRRTIFNYLKLDRHFDAADKQLLRKRGMADDLVPLLRLAALPPEDFEAAMRAIEQGDVDSIAAALAHIAGGEAIDPIAKKNSAFLNHFGKRKVRDRADFIAQLLAAYHKDGREKARAR